MTRNDEDKAEKPKKQDDPGKTLWKSLLNVFGDPVDLLGLIAPCAAFVSVLWAFRAQIHPVLEKLPAPSITDPLGAVLYFSAVIMMAVVVRVLSDRWMTSLYDRYFRGDKRIGSWFNKAKNAGLLVKGKLGGALNKYEVAKEEISEDKAAVYLDRMYQVFSKFSRSVSCICFLLAVIILALAFGGSPIPWYLSPIMFLLALVFLYAFCKFRLEASETVYRVLYRMKKKDNTANER